MTVEQRLEQLERKTNRLRIAVVVLAAALCGVVSMAATESKVGDFDVIFAKTVIADTIAVDNGKGGVAVALGVDDDNSAGIVATYSSTGKQLTKLSFTNDGGAIEVSNKTGEKIIQLASDDYGNGEVGVWNRSGKGKSNILTSQGLR